MARADQQQRIYGAWITGLTILIAAGIWCYLRQLDSGLGLTGMSRDVSWGLYIGQFTFADGLAASAVLLLLPYYSGRSTLYGQFVAIAGVTACVLSIVADMGRPSLLLNVLWYASPRSLMFWDMVSLSGYLGLNAVIAAVTLGSERKDVPPPVWLRRVIWISIPWAAAMQTISAFLYCALPGRPSWLTAILAPRFIVSSFASGPALLILLLLLLRRTAGLPLEQDILRKLGNLVSCAMALQVSFILLEAFTVLYSGIPEPMQHFRYLYLGVDGRHALVPWMWTSLILALASLVLLFGFRRRRRCLAAACVAAFASVWIDKGLGMVIGGFVPSPLGSVTEYIPTAAEVTIAAGIWATAALIATLFLRAAVTVRAYNNGNSELSLIEQEVSH